MKYIFIIISTLIISLSCRKEISFTQDLLDDEKYFLNAILSSGDGITVDLGNTVPISEEQIFSRICDADVGLYIDSKKIDIASNEFNEGICLYEKDLSNQGLLSQYSLQIKTKNGNELRCDCEIPDTFSYTASVNSNFIDSISFYDYIAQELSYYYRYEINIEYIIESNLDFSNRLVFGMEVLDPLNAVFQSIQAQNFNYFSIFGLINSPAIAILESSENKTYQVSFTIRTEEKISSLSYLPVVLYLDENLYNYYTWYDEYSSEIDAPFVVPDPPFTNIVGGNGVCGALYEKKGEIYIENFEY